MSDWTCPEPPAPANGPDVGPIRPILQGYLEQYRWVLLRQCAGLTGDQLASPAMPPSTLTLLGLVRHMAKVERVWFRIRMAGEAVDPLYPAPDEDFEDLDPATAQQVIEQLQSEVIVCDLAVKDIPLEQECRFRNETTSLGSIYLHMVEEYARHCGHADLLREAIDGVTKL